MTENPAVSFMTVFLAESIHGADWADISDKERRKCGRLVSDLITAMYDAGFTIPQPDDPEGIWANLRAKIVAPTEENP